MNARAHAQAEQRLGELLCEAVTKSHEAFHPEMLRPPSEAIATAVQNKRHARAALMELQIARALPKLARASSLKQLEQTQHGEDQSPEPELQRSARGHGPEPEPEPAARPNLKRRMSLSNALKFSKALTSFTGDARRGWSLVQLAGPAAQASTAMREPPREVNPAWRALFRLTTCCETRPPCFARVSVQRCVHTTHCCNVPMPRGRARGLLTCSTPRCWGLVPLRPTCHSPTVLL